MCIRIGKIMAIAETLALLIGLWGLEELHRTYTLPCTVVSESDGIVECEDCNGNLWEFSTENGSEFNAGDYVELRMNNNGTRTEIIDDRIVGIL